MPEWCTDSRVPRVRFPTKPNAVVGLSARATLLLCSYSRFSLFAAMLIRLFAPQFLVVWAFVGSAVAVHFRGKVRLGFWREASDHSTIMGPYNVLMYLFSAVPNRPILQQGSVPETREVRHNW